MVLIVLIIGIAVGVTVVDEQQQAIQKEVAKQWAEKALNESNVTVVQNGEAVKLPDGRVVDVPDRDNMSVNINIELNGGNA